MDKCTNLSKNYGKECTLCNDCGKVAKLPDLKMNETIKLVIEAAYKAGQQNAVETVAEIVSEEFDYCGKCGCRSQGCSKTINDCKESLIKYWMSKLEDIKDD